MLDKTSMLITHVKHDQTPLRGDGLRDFFQYRDLGVAEATRGKVLVQLVKAHSAPENGTGWHRHEADFHTVIMLKGWARFMYEDRETMVAAGGCVHQRPGIRHYLFDYSRDMGCRIRATSRTQPIPTTFTCPTSAAARCRGSSSTFSRRVPGCAVRSR